MKCIHGAFRLSYFMISKNTQVTTKVYWVENTFISTSVPNTRRCVQTRSAADPCTSLGKVNHCCRLQPELECVDKLQQGSKFRQNTSSGSQAHSQWRTTYTI